MESGQPVVGEAGDEAEGEQQVTGAVQKQGGLGARGTRWRSGEGQAEGGAGQGSPESRGHSSSLTFLLLD